MPFTVTFTATAFVAGSLRSSGNTLLVDDPTARMLVDLGVATAPGLTAQTGAVAPNLARTDGATFTGKLNTLASATTGAGLNLPHGAAPSSPLNGDVWSTTSGLVARINGGNRTMAQREGANTYTSGAKQTVVASATTAGFNVSPVAGDPSTPANGDVWHNSTTFNLLARVNGKTEQLNSMKAWVNFGGTGTVAIRAAFNVSSITDNGVGDYTVNFTSAFADTNYALVSSSYGRTGFCVGLHTAVSSWTGVPTLKSSTAARIATSYYDANLYDVNEVHVAFLR